jgi:TfoX/Sxy family transcriptional regulator of competence genes
MAKEYFEKLSALINELKIAEEVSSSMEVKHFFSGAALYVNETICASWSPVGLAFKLPEKEAESLIEDGKAKPLRYFPKGHIKKGYALFEITSIEPSEWKSLFTKAVRQV